MLGDLDLWPQLGEFSAWLLPTLQILGEAKLLSPRYFIKAGFDFYRLSLPLWLKNRILIFYLNYDLNSQGFARHIQFRRSHDLETVRC